MKKYALILTSFVLALFSGVMCLCFGCKKAKPPLEVEYVTCDEKFSVADSNGWKRGVESEALPNLNTQGLESEAYDFSLVSDQNYGLPQEKISGVTTKGFGLDLDLKNGYITLKFSHVDYTGFLKYVTYLYDNYGANLDAEAKLCDDVSLLIQTNNSENMLSYTFEAYFTHHEKTYMVKVFYVQAGNNSMVTESEMYLTLPLIFKGALDKDKIESHLGEVVETWPGWTHLNYAQTPVYNYIPSIYSEYYEINVIDGWTQIYVPSYTNKMQEFYEDQLVEAGFFETTFDECAELKTIAEKSVTLIPGNAKVFKLKLFQNCWYVAVYRHGTYLQISPVLKQITSREEKDFYQGDFHFSTHSYDEYLQKFNEVSRDFHFMNSLIEMDPKFGVSYIIDYKKTALDHYLPQYRRDSYNLTITQIFSNEMPYEEYLKYYKLRHQRLEDLKYQDGGVYTRLGHWTNAPGIRVAGTNLCFTYENFREGFYHGTWEVSEDQFDLDYETYKDDLTYLMTNDRACYILNANGKQYFLFNNKIEPTSNGKIKFYIEWTYEFLLDSCEESVDYSAFYKNYKKKDVVQELIDSKILIAKVGDTHGWIEKDGNHIVLTSFDHEKLEDCYQEVIEFSSEENRINFEKTFTFAGDEKFYSSLGKSGLLSENMAEAKIPVFLSGIYNHQNAANDQIEKFIEDLNNSEIWQKEFMRVGCPSSSDVWMDENRFYENSAALEYAAQNTENQIDLMPPNIWPKWLSWGSWSGEEERFYMCVCFEKDGSYKIVDYHGRYDAYMLSHYDFTTVMFERTIEKLSV